ncbi:MAG: deoxyribodipyrimidine photo-lyase [Saprospiraceae bacterium]|nr:deoxyribodipyrimidine photo-lyase [Saprospiraceae bacterium]
MNKVNIFWFRRDLRLHDNAGLYHALKCGLPVLPLFIFDTHILNDLEDRQDARVGFLQATLSELSHSLQSLGSSILIKQGTPVEVWKELLGQFSIQSVFTNRDYEPYALERDHAVQQLLGEQQIQLHSFKDHVIFEKDEVVKDDGLPYTVFTPYSRKWKLKLQSRMSELINENGETTTCSFYLKPYPNEHYFNNFFQTLPYPVPALKELGFEPSTIEIPPKTVSRALIKNYGQTRDIPGIPGTSRLGIHFRFGTLSIREKALRAAQLSETFLNELIWRDFYSMILWHFPHVATRAFKPAYDKIGWRYDEADFQQWCAGKTGYPLVDAGMRELNATGFMHNRVRMVTASFLTKHLLLDWRWGEAYFAKKLLDFDLASNNGGWQWAAGSGTDAAPYFRVFNPTAQQEKFDKDLNYIKRWVPEYGTSAYPKPMVDHKMARERCLKVYKEGLGAF